MSDRDANPYASPTDAEATSREAALQRWAERPIGITIVAGMLLVRGLMALGSAAFVWGVGGQRDSERIGPLVEALMLGRHAALVHAAFALFGMLVAIGAMRGKTWAWVLAYILGAAKLTLVVGLIFRLYAAGYSMGVGEQLVRATGVMVAMIYGVRPRVLRYVGMPTRRLASRLVPAVLLGCTIGGFVLYWPASG